MAGSITMTKYSFEILMNNSSVHEAMKNKFKDPLPPGITRIVGTDAVAPTRGIKFKCDELNSLQLEQLRLEIEGYVDEHFSIGKERGEIDVGVITQEVS